MSRPKWENDALRLIMSDGVAIEDCEWVLELITKEAKGIQNLEDADQFPLFMEFFQNNREELCNLDAETFSSVLACLGVNLHSLEDLWERKHIDPPIDEVDWSLE